MDKHTRTLRVEAGNRAAGWRIIRANSASWRLPVNGSVSVREGEKDSGGLYSWQYSIKSVTLTSVLTCVSGATGEGKREER